MAGKIHSGFEAEKRRTLLPFYSTVGNKESFSLVTNLQCTLSVLNQSETSPEKNLKKKMRNALRQLIGQKAQRPSPMEMLLVLEKQQARMEQWHQDLCEQVSKATDSEIRQVAKL